MQNICHCCFFKHMNKYMFIYITYTYKYILPKIRVLLLHNKKEYCKEVFKLFKAPKVYLLIEHHKLYNSNGLIVAKYFLKPY